MHLILVGEPIVLEALESVLKNLPMVVGGVEKELIKQFIREDD